MVFQLSVSGLNHKSFEGGVVLCPELEADQLAGLHPLPGHSQEGGAGQGLGGVVMTRGQAWETVDNVTTVTTCDGNLPWHAESGAPMEKEDTSLSPDNRMTENSKATRICILNHFFSVLSVELIQSGKQPGIIKLVFPCSEMMRYINMYFHCLHSWHEFSLLVSETSLPE